MKQRYVSDQQLWEKVLVGESQAWDELVDRHGPLVYAVCSFIGISEADADDVFQHTWLALFENRFRLLEPGKISSWLLTTAKREALRCRQRQAYMQPADCLVDEADSRPLPDQELQLLELQAELETALRIIDRDCRKLLYAFFFADDDKSYGEIAADFGLSPNSLGPKRRRCLGKLRDILISMGYLEERN